MSEANKYPITNYPHVIRHALLNEVMERMEFSLKQHCSDFIEIVGDAGMGKSVFLNQIKPALQINGIFSDLLFIRGSKSLQLSAVVLEELISRGRDTSLIEQYKGNIKTLLYKSFVSIKTPESDVFILMIDDAHLLTEESLNILRAVFNKVPGSRLLLILCGRPGFETNPSLRIGNFTQEEFLDYFSELFDLDWLNDRHEITHWFSAATERHPYRLSLLTDLCIQKGYLTHTYTAPIDLFMKLDFPVELLDAIKQRFSMTELSKDERNLIAILSHSFSGWTKKELQIISGKPCLKIIRKLVQKQWIIKDNRNAYRIVHPVLLEWIKSQCKDESVEIYRRILNSGVRLSKSEECAYLLTKKSQTDSERKTLLEFSSELANDGLYFSANQILEKLNPDFDQLEIGVKATNNFAYLGDLKKAKQILKNLMSKPPEEKSWKIYNQLGYYALVEGKTHKAESILAEGLSLPNLTEEGLVRLHYRIALVYANQWNLDEVHKSVGILKEHAKNEPSYDLLYYSIVANLNTNISMKIDTESFIKEGVKLANKQHNHQQAAYFQIALCYEYIKTGDMEKLTSAGKRLLTYGIDLFDTNIQHQAHYLLSHGYFNCEDYVLAIKHMQQTISILEKTKIAYNRDSSLSTLVLLYNMIGCGIKEKATFETLEKWTKDHPIFIMEERLKFIRHKIRLGQQKDGLEDLQKLMEDSTEKADEIYRLNAKIILSTYLISENVETALLEFDQSLSDLKRLEKKDTHHRFYFDFAFQLATHERKSELEKILEDWKKNEKTKHPVFFLIIEIMLSALLGKHRSVYAQIWNLENQFAGNYLKDYCCLYHFLADKFDGQSKAVARYKFIADCFEVIIWQKRENFPKKNLNNKNGFAGLLYEWARAIHDKDGFDNRFLVENDFPWMSSRLEVWDISLVDKDVSPVDSNSNHYPVIINLLGQVELFVNGMKLTGKDWTSRKTLEVLAYLILKGYKHKSSVLIDDLFEDIWSPLPEKREQSNKYKNTTLSRLRKLFQYIEPDFIVQKGNRIGINWESNICRLDIDYFERAYNRGMKLLKSGNEKDAMAHFEIADEYYRGSVAKKLGSQWIEPYRATFFQMVEDVKDKLK